MRFRQFSAKEKFLPTVILLAIAILFISNHFNAFNLRSEVSGPFLPAISKSAENHILNRHLHAAGMPCKSEFPANWSADKVINTVATISKTPSLKWREEKNGYFVTEYLIEGVKVRVVLDDDKSDVITAYPVNLIRNPCPANDN